MNNKKGEWLLVHGENFMSLQPQYRCSICNDIISTSNLPNECSQCGSINEYKGNSISVSIKEECKHEWVFVGASYTDFDTIRYYECSKCGAKDSISMGI